MIFKNLFRPKQTAEQADNLVLIIGLGNPGSEYQDTRHNAGFLAIDYLHNTWRFEDFHREQKFHSLLAKGTVGKKKILLVKPETFMNHSGDAVRKLVNFYHVSPKEIIVIHDDIDLEPGMIKETFSSRSAGHHGVENIIEALGTQEFRRIRLGIGRPTVTLNVCMPIHDYVVGKFTTEEKKTLTGILPRIEQLLNREVS